MKPYYSDDLVTLHHGDCLDVLRSLPDASVDAVVTDAQMLTTLACHARLVGGAL